MLRRIKKYILKMGKECLVNPSGISIDGEGLVATTGDPHFYLKGRIPAGWYVVESKVESKVFGSPKLYVNTGSGFSEDESIQLFGSNNKLVKRFIYIKSDAKLRYDPIEGVGEFSIEHFSLRAVTGSFAKKRIVQKIRNLRSFSLSRLGIPECEINSDYWKVHHKAFQQQYRNCFDRNWFHDLNYSEWLKHEESFWVKELPKLPTDGPLFSIVVPVYNPPIEFLKECIESVKAQSYENWELCICDDASTDEAVQDYLREVSRVDSRINLTINAQNTHISVASNNAISLAKGDFIALLDHDDLLPKHALAVMAREVLRNKDLKFIYSDEDKVDAVGKRFMPHFKPDFSLELLLANNYICHFTAIDTDLVRQIGGFRKGYEGSQDHDLFLRALAKLSKQEIVHLPFVLYHWRAIEGSTALQSGEKNYTEKAGINAVRSFLSQENIEADVYHGSLPNTYDVRKKILVEPLVSLLIPTRDRIDILKVAIDSILAKTSYSNYEVIVLDNDSETEEAKDYFSLIEKYDQIKVVKVPGEFNFSHINNVGVEHAKGDFIALVNNDVEVINPEWLSALVSQAQYEDVGCVGAKLLYTNDRIQHAGIILGIGGVANHSHLMEESTSPGYFNKLNMCHEVSGVTAACLLVRKSIFQEVGGLDEVNLKVAFNDVDFCLKVRAKGYRNLFEPRALLYHHESVSRGRDDSKEKKARFESEVAYMKSTWEGELENDPYYNLNFDLARPSYLLGLRAFN